MGRLIDSFKAYITDDATALATDIATGKTAYVSGGKVTGAGYFPAMMQYDGSTGYYGSTPAYTGNKVTVVARFKISSFTGNTLAAIQRAKAGVSKYTRLYVYVGSSDNSNTDFRNKVICDVYNSTGTVICLLVSTVDVADGAEHTVMASFDGDLGIAQLIVDGVDVDDVSATSRVAPTTGTLATGSTAHSVGSANNTSLVHGSNIAIGFCGYADAYLTNWSDFMDSTGNPIKQDEAIWGNSGWGSQPLFWNEHGDMVNNKGSAGAMTRNGTIVVAPA